jgi:hypothetical protein
MCEGPLVVAVVQDQRRVMRPGPPSDEAGRLERTDQRAGAHLVHPFLCDGQRSFDADGCDVLGERDAVKRVGEVLRAVAHDQSAERGGTVDGDVSAFGRGVPSSSGVRVCRRAVVMRRSACPLTGGPAPVGWAAPTSRDAAGRTALPGILYLITAAVGVGILIGP